MSLEEEQNEIEEDEAELELAAGEVADNHDGAAQGGADNETAGTQEGEEVQGQAGKYNAKEVNDQVFDHLRLPSSTAAEVQECWRAFLASAESREAAGEAIYAALFDSAPSIQSLFKTPRAVMSMRFMNGISQIIGALTDPKALKVVVETLGFQHLDLEVTVPRVVIFRDAIADLLAVEMGARLTPKAKDGFLTFLNYVGGSYIFIRVKFSERLKILMSSWAVATKKEDEMLAAAEAAAEVEEGAETGEAKEYHSGEADEAKEAHAQEQQVEKKKSKSWLSGMTGKQSGKGGSSGAAGAGADTIGAGAGDDARNSDVPKTYEDMFLFNAAVMGYGNHYWMNEVLASFDTIVCNVANSYRLQEECDVLGLRMAKYKGSIVLSEYKSVMLASLRSLCKDWGSQHEVAWSWLWENVERMIRNLMGKPAVQEKALAAFFNSLDENSLGFIRREVYTKFFAIAPAGQDYFKQSTTRLHFIADKLVTMTLDMFKDPKRMVEDISALGLRHVGYGIPTDLFGAFVTGCVQVVCMLTDNEMAQDAFRWSLSLISRILTRVINEGSTIVMKAINANSGKQLKKAVSCAPRGKRALWMLNIAVGTQSISPLMWAIETGSLESARAIIVDLLTIRADRDRYYYGMDILFERHPDIVQRMCLDAPALVPVLLDGLIWRSRVTENGLRRVNYYLKHLLMDLHGDFSKTIEWVTDNGDPKLVCHPVISMVTDMVWGKVAFRTFLWGRTWFLFTLMVFITSQSILNHIAAAGDNRRLAGGGGGDANSGEGLRTVIFVLRIFIYVFSLGNWTIFHVKNMTKDFKAKSTVKVGCIRVPEYLAQWQGFIGLLLALFLLTMLFLEPILHCISDAKELGIFTEHCDGGEQVLFTYSVCSTAAMLMYFLLLTDLSVFSTRVSAFVLVCSRVITEVALFMFGLLFLNCAFGCAASALEQANKDFGGIHKSGLSLFKITMGMLGGDHFDKLNADPALLVVVFVYRIASVTFLLNLLIAQLNCAYAATYLDMLGFARLNRGKIVNDTMPAVPKWRWDRFTESLQLTECCEFGEGDIGIVGGLQVTEIASANVTTVDMIRRFGGSTSPLAQWPEEENAGDDEEDRFERMEKLIEKAMKRMATGKGDGKKGGGSSLGMSGSGEEAESGAEESAHGGSADE